MQDTRTQEHKWGNRSVIQERDIKVLRALHKFRYLSTGQVMRVGGFPSLDTARFRLRKMAGLNMVKYFEQHSGERVYFLTNDACEFIGNPGLNMQAPKSLLFVPHLLETIDFWLALMASPLRRREKVGAGFIPYFYNSSGRSGAVKVIQDSVGGKPYTPDGAMILRRQAPNSEPKLFFVEIDRGTSAPERVGKAIDFYHRYLVSEKFKAKYQKIYNWEFEYFRVLLVTNDAKRRERLRGLDIPQDFRKFLLFTENYEGDPLGKVWVNGSGEGKMGIVKVRQGQGIGRHGYAVDTPLAPLDRGER